MDALSQLNTSLAGRYDIEREIGAGGMATVYLARDVKHERRVALKVLRPELGAVLGVERFLAEIKVTANLQHPNLLPLFDSGEASGLLFYVMPYVEGESLRARLDREKQLPIDEAIRIATAIAGALDYAHRHNVIHRDLKPENILLQEGQPLIADFGIALAVSNAGGTRITQTGLSLGTPQYMSPEQATGDRVIDGRTDIYSLGAMTYEMLTGEPPHSGNTAQAIIAKVLTDKPRSIRLGRDMVAPYVEATVERALAKLPADRWATAHEFADGLAGKAMALSAAHVAPATGAYPAASSRPPLRRLIPWIVAAGALTIAAVSLLRTAPTAQPSFFTLVLSDSARLAGVTGRRVALSRDGSQIAYIGVHQARPFIVVRALADTQARIVRGSEGAATASFSPDGSWLVFVGDGKIKKVPTAGGSALVVSDSGGNNPDWGDGNQIVFQRNGAIWRVSAEGGAPQVIARADTARGQLALAMPHLLPGGSAALVTIFKGKGVLAGEVGVVSVPGGKITELGMPGSDARYASSGFVVFGRLDGTVYAAPFSRWRKRFTGPAVQTQQASVRVTSGIMELATSDDGTMVFVGSALGGKSRMVAVDRRGAVRPVADEEQFYGWPRVSPDGKRIATEIGTGRGSWDVWLYEIPSRTLTRLTNNFTGVRPGGWSVDGRMVAYLQADTALNNLKRASWIRADAGGGPENIITAKVSIEDISVGPPHTWLAFRYMGYQGPGDIWIAPLDSPSTARPFVATPADEETPRVSPDGRLIAYSSDETGRYEVYLRPTSGPGGRVQVSSGGGSEPVWTAGGRALFYRSPDRMMLASLSVSPEVAVTKRDTLFQDTYKREAKAVQYDAFPDGRELLMIRDAAGTSSLTVVQNWPELLRRRSAAPR